jgi:GNAT superfamily N-acetyltransferase
VRQTASAVGRRLRRLIYAKQELIVLVKPLHSVLEPRQTGDLGLEDIGPEHLPKLARLNRVREQPQADRRFAHYVAQGFHGFVALRDGEPLGYYWWVDGSAQSRFPDLGELGLGIELGEGDAYGSDFYLLEQHRGGSLAAEFLYAVESSLRDRGYERLWGYVLSDNRPARWIYSTRGYVPMWSVHRTRVLMVKRTTREDPRDTKVAT